MAFAMKIHVAECERRWEKWKINAAREKKKIRKDFRHQGNGPSSSPVVSFVVSIREIYGFAFTNTLFYRKDLSKYREFAPIESWSTDNSARRTRGTYVDIAPFRYRSFIAHASNSLRELLRAKQMRIDPSR